MFAENVRHILKFFSTMKLFVILWLFNYLNSLPRIILCMYVQQIQVGYQICLVWSYLTHIDAIIFFSKIVYPCCLSTISSYAFFLILIRFILIWSKHTHIMTDLYHDALNLKRNTTRETNKAKQRYLLSTVK